MVGIYRLYNTIDNKGYIGQSTNIERRINYHLSLLRDGNHWNDKLQNAYNTYGESSFTYEVLEDCSSLSDTERDLRERYWIVTTDNMNLGYNKTTGGEYTSGWKHDEETKGKISKALTLNNGMHNPEVAKRANSDRVWLDESRKKLSDSMKRYWENSGRKSKVPRNKPTYPPGYTYNASQARSESNCGRIWVNNGEVNRFIYPEDLSKLSKEGFVKGRLMSDNINSNESIHKRGESISLAKSWKLSYNGQVFIGFKSLTSYINEQGCHASKSVIQKFALGVEGYRAKSMYPQLIGAIKVLD